MNDLTIAEKLQIIALLKVSIIDNKKLLNCFGDNKQTMAIFKGDIKENEDIIKKLSK